MIQEFIKEQIINTEICCILINLIFFQELLLSSQKPKKKIYQNTAYFYPFNNRIRGKKCDEIAGKYNENKNQLWRRALREPNKCS